MKSSTKIVAALAATAASIALALPIAAHADGERGGRQCHSQQRDGGHGMRGGHGEMRRMLHGLDLSEAQRDGIFELMHAQAPAMRAKGKEVRASHEALRALSMSGAYDDAKARELAESGANAMAEMARMKARLGADILALLDEEQRSQLRERLQRESGDRHRHQRIGMHTGWGAQWHQG